MDPRRATLVALIVASWLTIIGSALLACWLIVCCLLLHNGHQEHLAFGSVSLAFGVLASGVALKLDRNVTALISAAPASRSAVGMWRQ
jgi:hypothetical protein